MLGEVGKRPGGDPRPLFRFARAGGLERRGDRQMTIGFPEGNEARQVDLLDFCETTFREVAEEIARALGELRNGKLEEARVASAAVRDMKAAFQLVMEERTRVDKLRKQAAGAAGGAALDLGAARDEIGRRLACLRDAGGG